MFNNSGPDWTLVVRIYKIEVDLFGGRRHFARVDFCRISTGSQLLTGEGREEGGESQFWKVKEDLEDLGVTCIWSLDTSAGLPRRHTSVFSFLSRIQNFVSTYIGTFSGEAQ